MEHTFCCHAGIGKILPFHKGTPVLQGEPMPFLPLDHPEPFAATLGVMLYPGEDDKSRRKALAFASQYLAEPIREFIARGLSISHNDLLKIATESGEPLVDLQGHWWRGSAAGELFKTCFALANTDASLASWNNAARIVTSVAGKQRERAGRSFLMEARSEFFGVVHLWAAWSIREHRFSSAPESDYDLTDDFHSFLAEAEILRHWGQSWRHSRRKAEPLLPENMWTVPDDWTPPERKPGWPPTGKVPALTLPDHLIAELKPAGRPRKSSR